MEKIVVGFLGCGNIGCGVYKLLETYGAQIEENEGVGFEVRKILVRSLNKSRAWAIPSTLLTDRPEDVLDNPEIDMVMEFMGGERPAASYMVRALENGQCVITANKMALATHWTQIVRAAREHAAGLYYEASVCGAVPIIRAINGSLQANRISSVMGIINGTTNYILTEMIQCGKSFAQALREAQQKGYAEADPTADVEGIDAGRKICILADLCFGKNVPPSSITTEGITKITPADIECARILGYKIKLLGRAMRTGPNSVSAFVAPHLVSKSNPLANVDGVINGISVKGDAVGEAMFFGPGAGAHPTASAVAGDIIDCVRDPSTRAYMGWWPSEPGYVTGPEKLSCRWMVRVVAPLSQIGAAFQGVRFIPAPNAEPDEYAFVTPYMPGEELSARMSGMDVRARYRVLD